jgi:hypothetical protein
MQLAHMRVVERRQTDWPLTMLIALWKDRLEVNAADPRIPLGGMAEIIDQTIAQLQRLQQIEASSRA